MKIFKILTYVFGTVVAIVAVLLIVASFPITGNYKIYIVESGSMAPTIPTGSLIAVKPATQYKVGDVITFGPLSARAVPTTHRIQDIGVQDGRPVYVTKGDANNAPDAQETLEKDIAGKVVLRLPYAGYLVATAKTPIGFIILIVFPALLVVFDEIKKIYLEVKKMRLVKSKLKEE